MSTISTAQQPRGASRTQLLVAGILGLLAAGLVFVVLSNAEGGGSSEQAAATTPVLVAAQPIQAGARITDQMLTVRALPATAVVADAYREADKGLVVGKVARYPISQGSQVSASLVVEGAKSPALSFQIPPGLRGMTIPVSITNTPAALIAPGDFVDVIVSVEAFLLTGRAQPQAQNQRELRGAATLLQNIQVLSVARDFANTGAVYEPSTRGTPPGDKEQVQFVTLAVTPEQAQLLWLAQENGKLTLVLRPFGDDGVVPLAPRLEPLQLAPLP